MTFREWLDKNKLSVQSFSERTGIGYQTVARWSSMEKRKPRKLAVEKVKEIFPDCPLAS